MASKKACKTTVHPIQKTYNLASSCAEGVGYPIMCERTGNIMNAEYVKNEWNKNADQYNQWNELCENEKIEFAIQCAAKKAAELIQDPKLSNEVADGILYT